MEAWDPYPDVGLPELDVEHRALGAKLHEVLRSMIDDDPERTLALARKLGAAVEAHFAHEEALMREVACPDAARHIASHREFVAEAARRFEDLAARGLSEEFLRWAGKVDEWFRRHVMTEDMWLALAVVRRRRISPGAAK